MRQAMGLVRRYCKLVSMVSLDGSEYLKEWLEQLVF
jgi:hypothetical protein